MSVSVRLLLVAGLVACGSVKDNHIPDASNPDASIDGPPHGVVTVTVLDPSGSGALSVGVPVVFIAADGSTVSHPVTGSDGKASGDVGPGASVVVVEGTQMIEIIDVKPGDNLTVGFVNQDSTVAGTVTVSFPLFANATSYDVYGPCGQVNGTTSPIVLTIRNSCKQSTMELQVHAFGASGFLGYIANPNVPFVPGGSATITGPYLGFTGRTASYTNIASNVATVGVTRFAPDNDGPNAGTSGAPAGGAASFTVTGPTTSTSAFESAITHTANAGQQRIYQTVAGSATTYTLDVGSTLLPWLGIPTVDPATRKVTVARDTTGTTNDPPDAFFSLIEYQRTAGTMTTLFQWLVIGPTAGDFTLPQLPIEVGDVNPKSTDMPLPGIAEIVESDALAGWDAVRPNLYQILGNIENIRANAGAKVRLSQSGGLN